MPKMTIETKTVKLSEIKINPDNPRIITEKDMAYLVKSLQEFPDMMKSVTKYKNKIFVYDNCGRKFKTRNAYHNYIPKYCSRECYGESNRGKKVWNSGLTLSDTHRKALSDGRKNSPKCKGPKLYNWKGGDATFRDRSKIYQNERRAKIIGGGKIDPIFLSHLWEAHNGCCFYCEHPLLDYKCLEHLTPLSKGGKNQPFNLVYSCKSCNSKKRQKSLEDYAIMNGKIWLIDKWEDIFIEAYRGIQEAQCNTAN